MMDSNHSPARNLNFLATTSMNNDSNSAKDHELMNRTFKLLKNGDKEIQLHNHFKRVILILGDTGNGKTKFTNWIAGDNTKLIARETEEGNGEYLIEDINNRCSSTLTSETIYPQLLVDDELNLAYYDCPGFNDTRDSSYEIATTYFIKKIVNHAESVKLIFIINYPSVRKGVDRHNFMNLVKHVIYFVKNIQKFKNSIVLIVTKVDNLCVKEGNSYNLVDSNKIISAVANFLKEIRQDLGAKLQDTSSRERQLCEVAMEFISILLVRDGEHYTRIGIFRRPDQSGPLSEISLLQKDKRNIKRLICEKLAFSEKECDDFGYTVSEKCKNDIYYFVEEINTSVWSCLCRVKEEIKEYYYRLIKELRHTVNSFVAEASSNACLYQAREPVIRLRDICHRIQSLVKDVISVTNLEDLARKLNTAIDNLDIDISKNDLMDIENQGKCLNFLQVVSDRKLSTRPWNKLFREIDVYLSNVWKELQEDINVVAPKICKQVETDFQQIAKALQKQFDEKTKQMDIKEALEVLGHSHDAMLIMMEKTKNAMNITEVLKIGRDVTRNINIILPNHNTLNAIKQEKNLNFLIAISKTEIRIEPSVWTQTFESVIKHLNESKIWYRFLDALYIKFSEYEVQKSREKYNVAEIEDWGKNNKTQGIVITKNNFKQFLGNIAEYNIAAYDEVKNITLTELRLDELNHVINLTLKHRMDIQCTEPSIFIRGDYIITKEILAYEYNLDNRHKNFLAALKSGLYKYVHIFALKKVFIDQDISFPGMELRVISPQWEIIGTRTISLDGVDGKPHYFESADDGDDPGSDGEDGQPGTPGNPGGNFFGIGESFVNGANLTITVNGGNGGPGQHGGDGEDGKCGEDVEHLTDADLPPTSSYLECRIGGFECERIFNSDVSSTVRYQRYRIFGSPGQIGGNGGNGGKGGSGGNPGNVFIFHLEKDSRMTTYANKGRSGKDGRKGKGGKGGMNGDNRIVTIKHQLHLPYIFFLASVSNEWEDQFVESNKTRASPGNDGIQGINTSGWKFPKPSNAVSEPFKFINDYKRYAIQNLIFRFKKPLLLHFIALLDASDEIKNVYNIFGLIDEVQNLEKEYSKFSKHLDFIPFYHSVLDRTADYAKRIKSSENSKENKKALRNLYATALSRVYILRDKSQTNLIIDISRYLDMLKKDIEAVKDLQTASNKTTMKKQLKEDYTNRIDKKIDEAKYLIRNQILLEFNNIGKQIDDRIGLLIEETIKLQEKFENETSSLIRKREELEQSLVTKRVFLVLKFIALAVGLLGPAAKYVGSVVGSGISVAEMLVSNDKETCLDQISSYMPNAQIIENEIKTFKDETLSSFNKYIEDILLETEDQSDLLQDELKLEFKRNAIKRSKEKVQYLKLNEEKIFTSITLMITNMEDYLHNLRNQLDSKSHVILDITKWQVQRTLKHLQLLMHELTRGFKVDTKIARCVEMLQEVMTILINIYVRIQHYQEQKTLAEYIADISSNPACSTNNDPKLANALNQLDIAIKSNLVLKQYKIALCAFSQWVFPFSETYLQEEMLPSYLESEKTMENLVFVAASHIDFMKNKIDSYKASVMKKDKHLHFGEFNSRNLSTKPFFVWKHEYKSVLAELLSGQEVFLKADIKKSPADKLAIKFNHIDFQFRCNTESLQSQLTQTLKRYDIMATHMGNSYYRFNGKIYLNTSDSQAVYYSFEKSDTGECVRSNAVYNKIKNGDLMLSPYAMWKIKLVTSTNKDSFVELQMYKDEICLELAGHGSYVTEEDALTFLDEGYNIIEIYTDLDQHLDQVDF